MRLNKKIQVIIPVFTLVVFTFALSISCSTSKPDIPYGFIQLVLYQDLKEPNERYSFFIIAEDNDGIENLNELYLYHDKEQLRWHITKDEWISYAEGDTTWIGTRGIAVKDGKLPSGVFRAELINKGGERGERKFTFDGSARYPFPELTVENGYYTIASEWPVNRFICYDRVGEYATTVVLPSLSGSVSQLNLPSSVRTVALWSEDPSNFCSAFTNVVSVR